MDILLEIQHFELRLAPLGSSGLSWGGSGAHLTSSGVLWLPLGCSGLLWGCSGAARTSVEQHAFKKLEGLVDCRLSFVVSRLSPVACLLSPPAGFPSFREPGPN